MRLVIEPNLALSHSGYTLTPCSQKCALRHFVRSCFYGRFTLHFAEPKDGNGHPQTSSHAMLPIQIIDHAIRVPKQIIHIIRHLKPPDLICLLGKLTVRTIQPPWITDHTPDQTVSLLTLFSQNLKFGKLIFWKYLCGSRLFWHNKCKNSKQLI